MNVIVIEDERLTAQRLVSLLKRYNASINVLQVLPSVSGAISWFENNSISVALIFMDIHLEDGDSFEIIGKLNLNIPIIFTTAYDDYMVKAFKVNSIDYLMKPIDYEELVAAMRKFESLRMVDAAASTNVEIQELLRQINRQAPPHFKDRFMITVGTKIRTVKTENVAYFYLEEKTVFLVTTDGVILPVDYSLEKLVQVVDPRQFFRVSRQFIVSLNAIQVIHSPSPGKLKLDLNPKSKHDVMVSGDRAADFKAWLGKD